MPAIFHLPQQFLNKMRSANILALDPQNIYNTYNYLPLSGVYNVNTRLTTLYPCMQRIIQLRINQSGNILEAMEETREAGFIRESIINPTDILNQLHFLPRYITVELPTGELVARITSHLTLLNLLGDVESRSEYRGFTLHNKNLIFLSGLNNRGPTFRLMENNYQEMIKKTLEPITALQFESQLQPQ